MKKTCSTWAMVALVALSFSSCAMVGTSAGVGVLYTEATDAVSATGNTVGMKVGKAKSTNVLGLVVIGNASINAAAKEAGITKISHVDRKVKSLLGLFATSEVIVYGE